MASLLAEASADLTRLANCSIRSSLEGGETEREGGGEGKEIEKGEREHEGLREGGRDQYEGIYNVHVCVLQGNNRLRCSTTGKQTVSCPWSQFIRKYKGRTVISPLPLDVQVRL